jgi:hypothetical protein
MSRIGFRHCDPRFPFLWASSRQPAARWHGPGAGPAHYFADTPIGAWAEFLRHEEIRDPEDLQGIRRSVWAAELPDDDYHVPHLPKGQLRGGAGTYANCQAEAARLRAAGAVRIQAPSAALISGGARGWVADPDERPAPMRRDGVVWVLYERPATIVGWPAAEASAPPERVLTLVRHF